MDVEYKGKDTIIHNLKDFDLGQTMECGQCFHFQKIDDDEYGMSAYENFCMQPRRMINCIYLIQQKKNLKKYGVIISIWIEIMVK